jgi:carboxymethylenebutenolidase
MPIMSEFSAKGIAVDISAAFDYLEQKRFALSRDGVVGFCMGGTVAFYAATSHTVGAAVTFYGGGVAEGRFGLPPLVELAANLKTPWLGLYGDLDKSISTEEVERLREAVQVAPVKSEIVRYPDADHGFNCDDRQAVFNPTAAADAWQRMLAWFDRHVQA